MRTKSTKEPKRVPENDLKINLSVPKVVLDASDCAKFLDGTGKTSVILVERDGKMVPASSSSLTSQSSSSISRSSTITVSTPSSFSSSLSSPLSKPQENDATSVQAISSKSVNLHHDASASSTSVNVPSQSSIQIKKPDQKDSKLNCVQDSVPLEQGKMILKPPKKRRGNDKGAYDESSTNSLVNGRNGHAPMQTVPHAVDTEEATALRTAPSYPVLPTSSSNSLQKHTIENLLQVSPSSSNNNNNSNSSNMNLISGTYSHQSYNSIAYPLHSDMCAGTAVPPLPALPALSSSSSPLSLSTPSSSSSSLSPRLLPSSTLSLSPSCHTSSTLHKNTLDSAMTHSSESAPPPTVYSYSNQSHPPQLPLSNSLIPTVPPRGTETATSNLHTSSSAPAISQPPPSPSSNSQTFSRTPPVQDEPINLSTSSKIAEGASTVHPIGPEGENLDVDNRNVQESLSRMMESNGTDRPEDAKIPAVIPSGVWKQNSDSSYSELSGIPHLQEENASKYERKDVPMDSDSCSMEGNVTGSGLLSNVCKNNSEVYKSDSMASAVSPFPSPDGVNEISKENDININELPLAPVTSPSDSDEGNRSSLQSSTLQLHSELSIAQSEGSKTEATSSSPLEASKSGSHAEASLPVKSKKSSKKKVEIPMDEESCAMRSSVYAKSIDDVIQNFEFVRNPNDEIDLTEEEEAILRQQFDDSGSVEKMDQGMGADMTDKPSVVNKGNKRNLISQPQKGNSPIKLTSKLSKKKGESQKQVKVKVEKLSPSMQNVVNILSLVAKDVGNIESPTESSLLDLDALLKSLDSKCNKKISLLEEESEKSENPPDAKAVLTVKKLTKTRSDISLFYPSDVMDGSNKTEPESLDVKPSELEDLKDVSNGRKPEEVSHSVKGKSKKTKKRKSVTPDTKERNAGSESTSTSSDSPKPKKMKKSKELVKKSPKKLTVAQNHSPAIADNPSLASTEPSEECPFMSGSKMDTSDIGESIASGGSDQMTPVHEPDTKDEGVNTDHQLEQENNDTGLESSTDDRDSKPVRHYKKRLDFVKCPHCEHQSRGRSALSRHMKKIHLFEADLPYKCHLCTYGCTKMASLNRHLFTHNVFPCSRCDFKTDERDKLTEHMAEQHKDKLDMKLCKKCNRYIKCESFTIEQHMGKCQGPIPFKCKECSKTFKYASSLKVHYHTHFPDQPKLFKCDLCDYRTNYKANLHKHHKNMHASRDRDVRCPDCGKLFSTEDNMRRHRKVHTLVRPFACETCKKTFKTAGALKGHQLIHTATRPFTCNIPGCSRSFRTPKFLKSHQEEFHRLVPKKFFCQVEGCNYSFFKRSHLKRHAITHTGERNYHCKWPGCSKSFRHADNLKVHFRSHTNEKPVQCHLCDFKSKQKNSLFWHKKKVHQIVGASAVGLGKHSESAGEKSQNKDEEISKTNSGEMGVEKSSKVSRDLQESDTEVDQSQEVDETSNASDDSDKGSNSMPVKDIVSKVKESLSKRSGGPLDLYEFKSDDDSEGESSSPLKWETVKAIAVAPLPPAPKELLLKNERLMKKERDKVEKAEQREQLKKDKADKKEQEKKDRAEKKEQERKDRAGKKELEKKERDEKKEQEKREKLEQKEMEKKEREEQREKEKKDKEEVKEKERKAKEEQKEQEKKEKEDQKEKERIEKEEQKEKEKKEKEAQKEAQKEKVKKDKERKRLEVIRLKMEAKKILHKRSMRAVRGMARKNSKAKLVKSSPIVKGKNPFAGLRKKSPGRAASRKDTKTDAKTDTKPGRRRKNKQAPTENVNTNTEKEKTEGGAKKKRGKGSKSPASESNDKSPSRSSSLRASSPRGASGGSKSPARDQKTAVVKAVSKKGKKKASSLPKRKPSARIKASQKSQTKAKTKKGPGALKKSIKNILKKTKGGKRGRPGKKDVAEASKEGEEEEEVCVADNGVGVEPDIDNNDEEVKKEKETDDGKVKKAEEVIEKIPPEVDVPKPDKEKVGQETKGAIRPPSPSSSEEDMLQGNASPYRDFSDAENMEKEEEEEGERAQSSSDSVHSEEAGKIQPLSESPEDAVERESNPCDDEMLEGRDNIDDNNEHLEAFEGEEYSDDEDINDIPLTPPRAPAPPPMESSEDEMEPEALDSSAPYSTPAPNTPFSVPGPNTPFSVPPPTNLMQQHSVHSEEMATGVSSVASMDLPSAGSVEMQQPLGSVESHPVGSVEIHPRTSTEIRSHGSVEMLPCSSSDMHPHSAEMHPAGSVEMHPRGSTEMHQHGNEMLHRTSTEMHSHGSVEMHPHGSVEMHPHGSVEMHPHGSVEMHPHGSVEMHPHGSVEMHPHGSVEMHPHGSVEMHPHGSVEMHPHGSVEMHPHGSVEMHPHGSVEMHPHGSAEMHPHGSVEMHPHGSVEMHSRTSTEMPPHSSEIHHHGSTEMHPHGSVEMHPHGSVEMHPHGSVEMHPHGSVEMPQQNSVELHHHNTAEMHRHPSVDMPPHRRVDVGHDQTSGDMQTHNSLDIHSHNHSEIPSHNVLERSQSLTQGDIHQLPSSLSQPEASIPSAQSEMNSSASMHAHPHDKFNMPSVLGDSEGNSSEADKRFFDQYLKTLSAHNNQAARSSLADVGGGGESSESRDLMSKSPNSLLQSSIPTSVITSMDNSSSLFLGQADLRRLEVMAGERHHQESLYARDTVSALSRVPDRQSAATPLLPPAANHATPTPTFDPFPSLNPLHSSTTAQRENAPPAPYFRQQENLFATPPVTSSFMAEAMFQRQSMTTPFLPAPQPTDRNSLSRIPDPTASLRTNNASTLLRRPSTMPPGPEMFTSPAVPQAVPRHPLTNAWSGQEVRPTHWPNTYLPRQPNMTAASTNPFFPAKDNYLAGREFMFDPSAVRSPTDRGMFSSLAAPSQSQDSLQFDRFDLSNYFPGAVAPYGTAAASSLDYTRTSHSAAPKAFDERYRQTAAAASAGLPDFRGLPPTSASTDRFHGIGVNSGFNLYPGNHPMPYHPQHMTENMNSAFLTHPSTAQQAMLERDYAAAAAHRGLYPHPHQNSPYPFIDERQYSGSSKLSHTHTTPTTVGQERDLMSRPVAHDGQVQDPYRSMLYRY